MTHYAHIPCSPHRPWLHHGLHWLLRYELPRFKDMRTAYQPRNIEIPALWVLPWGKRLPYARIKGKLTTFTSMRSDAIEKVSLAYKDEFLKEVRSGDLIYAGGNPSDKTFAQLEWDACDWLGARFALDATAHQLHAPLVKENIRHGGLVEANTRQREAPCIARWDLWFGHKNRLTPIEALPGSIVWFPRGITTEEQYTAFVVTSKYDNLGTAINYWKVDKKYRDDVLRVVSRGVLADTTKQQ